MTQGFEVYRGPNVVATGVAAFERREEGATNRRILIGSGFSFLVK
jgi:hypothetical protein